MKDLESSTKKCRSRIVELDMCRTEGCCPKALVNEEGATILVPVGELRVVTRDGKPYYVLDLDKSQVDRITLEMRRK